MSELRNVSLVARDVGGKRETWTAEIDGRQVEVVIASDDYLPFWGRVPYRDFVTERLMQQAQS